MGGKSLVIICLAFTLTFAEDGSLNGCTSSGVCSSYSSGATIVKNPTDCGSFCICTCDGAILMKCPSGLEYNALTQQCDDRYKANCSIPIPPPRPNGCNDWNTFCESAAPGILKPNPSDCGSFCECDVSGPVMFECPEGLHFSVSANRCEYPWIAGCDPGPGPAPTTMAPPPPRGNCDQVVDECKTSPVGTFLRNPGDCGSFCRCDGTTAVWFPCPAGLHFSLITLRCEFPADAGCIPGPPPTVRPADCKDMISVCYSSPIGTFLRNPSDCGSYCVCDGTTAVWMPCPSGLHFSVRTNRCEYPNVAGCVPGPDPTSGPAPTRPPPPPPTGDCNAMIDECKRSPVGTLLRNPGDCGSFCECDGTTAVWMPCPAGLHFSVATNRCEFPADAGCIPSPPTSGPHDKGCEMVEHMCPSDNIGNLRLLKDPLNCEAYCQCNWGKAIWMPCPHGLHFNPSHQICDWPSNAGC